MRRTRGIHCALKKFIINLIKYDYVITPKTIHRRIVLQPELAHLKRPSLKQVQNMINNYRINSGVSNSISAVIDIIKQYEFKENLDENRPFFFNIEYDQNGMINLGDGSDENHLCICITSKKLLTYLDTTFPGAFYVDATYKLIRNRFPLVVVGRTDMNQKFHLLALCVTSHEQEIDFLRIYMGLVRVADILDIMFDPEYIVQDACLASYNAACRIFRGVVVLMCYFHVILNCKKNKLDIPSDLASDIFKKQIHRLHMTTSLDHYKKYFNEFSRFCNDTCPDFLAYFKNSWSNGKIFCILLH